MSRFSKSQSNQPSLQMIARAARVSVPTASLALNDHPRVAAGTKLRVNEAATRLGYVPNQAARRLARGRASTAHRTLEQVGFVLYDPWRPDHNLDGPYLSIMRGVEHQVGGLGAMMVFVRVSGADDCLKLQRLLRAGQVDGWLAAGEVRDELLRPLTEAKATFVVVGGHVCRQSINWVEVSFSGAGNLAAEYLAGQGHRRIGFIGASMRYAYQIKILAGFRAAVKQLGLDPAAELIQTNENHPGRTLAERLDNLLALATRPTAIVTGEPNHAVQLLQLLQQRQVQVPTQISVMGCEVDAYARATAGITQAQLPFLEVGRSGAHLLHEIVTGPAVANREVRIAPTLLEGGTTRSVVAATAGNGLEERRATAAPAVDADGARP